MSERIVRSGYRKIFVAEGTTYREIESPAEHDELIAQKHREELGEFFDAVEGGKREEIAEEAGDVIETVLTRAKLHDITLPQTVEISPTETDKENVKEAIKNGLRKLNQAINTHTEDDMMLAGIGTIEAIFTYADLHGASRESVSRAMVSKRQQKGGFNDGVVLIEAD